VRADEKLTAFLEWELVIRSVRKPKELRERVKYRSTDCCHAGKDFVDYVIRRFNLPPARLNKPQRLDLR
jgi:hypothetical protein